MRLKSAFILSILFWFVALDSYSQRYGFMNFSVEDGLTHSQIRSIIQDENGFIWIGTLGGLSRFDGREFFNYSSDNGLDFSQIECLTQLSKNRIAVGSTGGMAIISKTSIETYSLGEGKSKTAVLDIIETPEGTLWLATQSGVYTLQNGLIKLWEKGLTKLSVSQICFQDSERLFLTRNSLLKWDGKKMVSLLESDRMLVDLIWKDKDHFWVATNGNGLIEFRDGIQNSFKVDDGLISNQLLDITASKDGGIWASSRIGFCKIGSDGSFKKFSKSNGLEYSEIRCLLEDREGNLWLGSDGGGLFKFLGESFALYSESDGLPSSLVMCIEEDQQGNMWIGSYDKGVFTLNNPDLHFQWEDGLANNKIWTSKCDTRGRMWFGTSGGLSLYDKGEFRTLDTEGGLNAKKVLSICELSAEELYVGTSLGVNRVNISEFKATSLPNSPISSKVRDILRTSEGEYWFATSSGIYLQSGIDFSHFGEEEGLADQSCSSIELDREGRLWIGTKSGLNLKTEFGFEKIKLGDTYSSNFINFLKATGEGMIVGTNNGIYHITSDLQTSDWKIQHFGINDGIGSLETNMNAIYEDDSGIIWFGTTAGLMKSTGSFTDTESSGIKPSVSIDDIRLDLMKTDWNKWSDSISLRTGLPHHLALPYGQNHLTFDFSGISMKYPKDVKYQFMLEGFDKDWRPITKTNFATYANIPDGDFQFKVKARNKEGMWSDTSMIAFSVLPPYWMTWWFILLAILLTSTIFYTILNRRKMVLVMKMEKEKLELKNRMIALEQQSLNSSMNRHFIFNALNSIQYYINRKDRISANKYLSSFAQLIRKNLDSSQVNHTTLSEELERLGLYLELEQMRFQDKFDYNIQVENDVNPEQVVVPSMLLQPFLENSIWHGILPKGEKGIVNLHVGDDGNGQIIFTIKDNGIGVNTSLLNKTMGDDHISKGMSITSGRLNLLRKITGENVVLEGPDEILDQNGAVEGTLVTLKMPKSWAKSIDNA